MKKLLPIILALALAVTSIIAFGTMFTGAEDPAPGTLVFTPDYKAGTAGYFSFAPYVPATGFVGATPYGDATTETVGYWGPYADSEGKVELGGGAVALIDAEKVIGLNCVKLSGPNNPTVVFTAPLGGTYTFTLGLGVVIPEEGQEVSADKGRVEPYTQKQGGTLTSVSVEGVDPENSGVTFMPGYRITAKDSEYKQYTVNVTLEEGETFGLYSFSNEEGRKVFIKDLTATLDLATAPEGLYTAAISSTATSVRKNENITVDVTIGNNAFNASEIAVNFDDDNFDFVSASAGTAKVTEEDKVVVENFGAENAAGTKISLTFKATSNTADIATFTLASAKASTAANAEDKNLEDAFISEKTVTVALLPAKYTVTLDSIFTGATEAYEGTDYVFNIDATGAHYDYKNVKVKIGDAEAVDATVNPEGGWIIDGDAITGPITITGERSAKNFTVAYVVVKNIGTEETPNYVPVDGDNGVTDDPILTSATYASDFIFNIKANKAVEGINDGWTYSVLNIVYTDTEDAVPYAVGTENDREITITGTDITADITVTIEYRVVAATEATVTKTGTGASDLVASSTATLGQNYTFTLTPAEGYTYTVKYTMGEVTDETLTPVEGVYTIENVSDNITITVTKEITNKTVKVKEYVKINGGTVYLVYVEAPQLEDGGYKLNDTVAYYVTNYSAYAVLVTVTGEEAAPDPATVTVAIDTSIDEALIALDGTYDVNGTGVVDANDAQLVYNIYNAGDAMMYDAEDVANMVVKYLNADKNGDKEVKSDDAQAIINAILEIE